MRYPRLFIMSLILAAALWAAISHGGLYMEDPNGNTTKLTISCEDADFNIQVVNKWGDTIQDAAVECGPVGTAKCASYYMAWEFLSSLKHRWEALRVELGCAEA